MEIAILACGCFWSPEIKFSKLKGVSKTEVGYCGGNTENTTYEEVCTGNTGHAEVVRLMFDEKISAFDLSAFLLPKDPFSGFLVFLHPKMIKGWLGFLHYQHPHLEQTISSFLGYYFHPILLEY